MNLSGRLWFRALNDLLHDLAAGIGPGAVLALWLVRGGAKATLDPVTFASLARTWPWILLVLFIVLVVLVITGAIRLSYRTFGVTPEALQAKGRAALIKHAVFVPLFIYVAAVAFMIVQP